MSAVERTRALLSRIDTEDRALNSFIRVDREEALSAASALDERPESGSHVLPLDGLVIAVKDNLAVKGKPWTAGIDGRRSLIASQDAAAVAKLRAAGAILIGGLNMEEAALGAVTDNPTFGRCYNPLCPGLTPGGSSGGSAAAVAAGFVDLAIGTDTMGSVRVPAAYCGIAGIKPTAGAIDRAGLAMLSPSLDTIGPLARDIGHLWPALVALASEDVPSGWGRRDQRSDLAGLTFGVPRQLAEVACEPEVLAGLDVAKHAVESVGGTVETIDLPEWNPGKSRRAGLLLTESEGALELADLMARPGAISDALCALLLYGRNAPPEKLDAARAEISAAAHAVEQAFGAVDGLLLPTAPQRAFAHGTPAPANQADLTALANFAQCPAAVLPVPLEGEILPASIQVLAPKWQDGMLLAWAEVLANVLQPPAT